MSVGGVVPGFAEMLMAMKPGETRTVYLPPEMAYGLQGRPSPDGGGIPPSSALVFDLTLVDVLAGQPQMGFSPEMMQQMMQQQGGQ
jgi:peptidylprolyl isomerase